jgi:phage terminase small subunit
LARNRRPRCPNGLNDEAQNLWAEAVAKYELGEHELSLLRSAVKALTQLRAVQSELERDGVTIRDRFDQVREHPNVRTLQVLDQQFRNNLSDLGLADADAELEKAQEKPATFNKNGGFLRKVH